LAYSGNTIKRVSRKPKGYIADTGVSCWSLAISAPSALASHPSWGAIFETAILAEVRKALSILSPAPNLYHWHTNAGAEVDILLGENGKFFPIEGKAASTPSRKHTSGFTAFRKTYPNLPIEKGIVVAPCKKLLQLSENDYAIPWDAVSL